MNKNTSPELKELKKFGLLMGAIIILIFGVILPLLLSRTPHLIVYLIGALFIVISLASPGLLGPVYEVWMRFGHIMNRVSTFILLSVVFYVIITPMGLIRRLAGIEARRLKPDKDVSTYRITSVSRGRESLERPF